MKKRFEGPKSVCKYGHTGDGEDSEHFNVPVVSPGHGACSHPAQFCECVKFTWAGWTPEFAQHLKENA